MENIKSKLFEFLDMSDAQKLELEMAIKELEEHAQIFKGEQGEELNNLDAKMKMLENFLEKVTPLFMPLSSNPEELEDKS